MKTITLQQLTNVGACPPQVELFREHFGEAVRVTIPKARKYATDYHWHQAARCLLAGPARKVFNEATVTASKAYHEAVALTCACTVTEWKKYKEAVAVAFATAYLSQEDTI
jgi:hypothetical protein